MNQVFSRQGDEVTLGSTTRSGSLERLMLSGRLAKSSHAQTHLLRQINKLVCRLQDEQEVHHLEFMDFIHPEENKWFEEDVVAPRVTFSSYAPRQETLFPQKVIVRGTSGSTEESVSAECAASEIVALKLELESLRSTLRDNLPYMRVFNFGASIFLAAVISFLSLIWIDIAIPFNPIFAVVALPVSIVFMIMGYMLKSNGKEWLVSR